MKLTIEEVVKRINSGELLDTPAKVVEQILNGVELETTPMWEDGEVWFDSDIHIHSTVIYIKDSLEGYYVRAKKKERS